MSFTDNFNSYANGDLATVGAADGWAINDYPEPSLLIVSHKVRSLSGNDNGAVVVSSNLPATWNRVTGWSLTVDFDFVNVNAKPLEFEMFFGRSGHSGGSVLFSSLDVSTDVWDVAVKPGASANRSATGITIDHTTSHTLRVDMDGLYCRVYLDGTYIPMTSFPGGPSAWNCNGENQVLSIHVDGVGANGPSSVQIEFYNLQVGPYVDTALGITDFIARYAFDGNANDASTNAYNGTPTGSPTYVTGEISQAVSLPNNSGSYVTLPSNVVDVVAGDFTVSWWGYLNGVTSYDAFFAAGLDLDFYIVSNTGARFYWCVGGSNDEVAFGTAVSLNAWNHYILTRDGTLCLLYVNNVLSATFRATGTAHTHSLKISGPGIGHALDGKVDEMRFYTRYMGATDRATIFNFGQTPTAPSALTATAISTTQTNLAWTDNATNETGFSIDYEQVDSGTVFTSPTTTTAAADAQSKSITGLTAGKRYIFRVKATNAAGSSSYTSTANATTDAIPTVSARTIPTGGTTIVLTASAALSVGAGGNGGLTLSMSGGAATATYASGLGSTSITYSLSRTIHIGETGTATYTQPGNGLEDVHGNDLATFTTQSVTNNSTQNTAPVLTLPTSTASVTVGGSTSVATDITFTDADSDNLTVTAVITTPTKATWGSLPSGWTQSPTGTLTCTARTAAQAQTNSRTLTVTGVEVGTTTITFIANDGTVDSNAITCTLTVSAASILTRPITIIDSTVRSNNIGSNILGVDHQLGTVPAKQADISNLRVVKASTLNTNFGFNFDENSASLSDDTSNNGVRIRFAGQSSPTSKQII